MATTSDLKKDLDIVYDEVQTLRSVKLNDVDRPPMIIILQSELDAMLKQAEHRGYSQAITEYEAN